MKISWKNRINNKTEDNCLYFCSYNRNNINLNKVRDWLKECFEKIKLFLEKENLMLNRKSRIYKNTNNFIFLGRNRKGRYAKYRNVKRKIKYKKYLYQNKKIDLVNLTNSIICYENLLKKS